MHGIKRVIVFCTLTAFLPTILLVIPLYLRHNFYAKVAYAVTESDILEIDDGISTIFCSEHTLQMNGSFNAFQMSHKPEITSYRKHIRLKKSMNLPDDTLEYWGFYLLKGATVALSVCSRFPGASILVVKGEKNLRTCGMLEHNDNKRAMGIFMPEADTQVKITFESSAQEINSNETDLPTMDTDLTAKMDNLPTKNDLPPKEDNLPTENNLTMRKNKLPTESNLAMKRNKLPTENNLTMKKNKLPTENNLTMKKDKLPTEDNLSRTDLPTTIDTSSSTKTNLSISKQIENKNDGNFVKEQSVHNDTEKLLRYAQTYIERRETEETENVTRKLRHAKKRLRRVQIEKQRKEKERKLYEEKLRNMFEEEKIVKEKSREDLLKNLKIQLNERHASDERIDKIPGKWGTKNRRKRNQDLVKPPSLLDQGIQHGGNAIRNSTDDESSVSSFEMGLFDCYEGTILIAQEFQPSEHCINVSYLLSGKHMQTRHNVVEDGYYYYIFYSDNDYVLNDIHALFDIYKPTFQYENVTKACVNKTECSFSLTPMSADRVIVEIPTRDGIEHELDDYNVLISICHPRMETYMIFPIAVLFFILGCAFL